MSSSLLATPCMLLGFSNSISNLRFLLLGVSILLSAWLTQLSFRFWSTEFLFSSIQLSLIIVNSSLNLYVLSTFYPYSSYLLSFLILTFFSSIRMEHLSIHYFLPLNLYLHLLLLCSCLQPEFLHRYFHSFLAQPRKSTDKKIFSKSNIANASPKKVTVSLNSLHVIFLIEVRVCSDLRRKVEASK